jgi:mannose-6-phosphate isomerase-like protein (cupin superfamily)
MPVITPLQLAQSLSDYWSPKVIAELDDSYIKVAKVKGVLAWHQHAEEDELFYVLAGELKIEMHDQTVTLRPGEMFVVPKGVLHNPIADQECLIMLIERKSTLHTGNVVTAKTRSIAEQLLAAPVAK